MMVIKSHRELADTLRRVAKSHPSHKLDDILDLHTCANIIQGLPAATDPKVQAAEHSAHNILEDDA